MGKRPRLYIAYGSNLILSQMAYRCPTAKVAGKGELKGYELLFRGGRRGAVATVEPKEGSTVPVLLWKIRETDEAALDRYEGYPRLYDKQMMKVEFNGKRVSAMAYVMTPGHAFGLPSCGYATTILEGYETAGFEPEILYQAIDRAFELVTLQKEQAVGESTLRMGGWGTIQ